MTLEEVKALLDEEYERAKRLEYVHNPLAYALYQVLKKVDTDNAHRTDLTNKCGSCRWSVPCMRGTKGTFGSCVACKNPNKVWRHEKSMIRQRTTPKCRYYENALERRENGK
jgi:hypothetical protein